jgi:hypothetical protein
MYEPLETVKCEKCGKTIAESKELIGIQKKNQTCVLSLRMHVYPYISETINDSD